MNSIIMITVVAGQIIGQANFSNIEECMSARAKVQEQQNVTATCTYQKVKVDNSRQIMKLFGSMAQEMSKLAPQNSDSK
jgi:hypothetical protein